MGKISMLKDRQRALEAQRKQRKRERLLRLLDATVGSGAAGLKGNIGNAAKMGFGEEQAIVEGAARGGRDEE